MEEIVADSFLRTAAIPPAVAAGPLLLDAGSGRVDQDYKFSGSYIIDVFLPSL